MAAKAPTPSAAIGATALDVKVATAPAAQAQQAQAQAPVLPKTLQDIDTDGGAGGGASNARIRKALVLDPKLVPAAAPAASAPVKVKRHKREGRVEREPLKMTIEQPLFANRAGAGQYVTFANRTTPQQKLPLGINSFKPFEHLYRAMTGASTKASPQGVFSLGDARFLVVDMTSPKCHLAPSAKGVSAASGNAIVGKPRQVMAICTHDAVPVLQFAATLSSEHIPVHVLLPPVAERPTTFYDMLNQACPKFIGDNIKTWRDDAKTAAMGTKELTMLAPPKDAASLTDALAAVLKDDDTLLLWEAPDWWSPTHVHYPLKPQGYRDVLLSPTVLKQCSFVAITQSSFWLYAMGAAERKELAAHWTVYAQRGSGYTFAPAAAARNDDVKALEALLDANDVVLAGGDVNALATAAYRMHTSPSQHAWVARDIQKAVGDRSLTDDTRRLTLFDIAMKGQLMRTKNKCLFIFVRKT